MGRQDSRSCSSGLTPEWVSVPEKQPSFWLFDNDRAWCCSHGTAPVGCRTGRGYVVGDAIDLYQWQHKLSSPGEATVELAIELGIQMPEGEKHE